MPFEVRTKRITTAIPGHKTVRTTVYCLAARDTPGARCLDRHSRAVAKATDYISWDGGLRTKHAVDLFLFLTDHRTESDPPPDELMLQLLPGKRKNTKRIIEALLVMSLQQAARGEVGDAV